MAFSSITQTNSFRIVVSENPGQTLDTRSFTYLVRKIEKLYIKEYQICFDFYKKCSDPKYVIQPSTKATLNNLGFIDKLENVNPLIAKILLMSFKIENQELVISPLEGRLHIVSRL